MHYVYNELDITKFKIFEILMRIWNQRFMIIFFCQSILTNKMLADEWKYDI